MFIFSCTELTSTHGDKWEQSSIVAETRVAEFTLALGIMLSLHQAFGGENPNNQQKKSFVCLNCVIVVV